MDHPKFCPHCAAAVVGQMRFCVNCGKAMVAQPPHLAPAPPPKKRNKAAIVFWAISIAFGVFGCYGLILAGIEAPRTSYTSGYDVEYRISGSTSRVDLTYENGDGATEQKSDARVPWSLKFKGVSGQFLYISAQNQLSSGSVTCEIRLNGEVVKTATSNGEYVIASCSGKI